MKRIRLLVAAVTSLALLTPASAYAFGLFVSNKGNIHLEEVHVFLSWDGKAKHQAITLQPILGGDTQRFSWILPTPSRPRLDEMPRDFFAALAAYTQLAPMEPRFAGKPEEPPYRLPPPKEPKDAKIRIIETFHGGPDYWLIEPGNPARLKDWVEREGHDAARVEELLGPYLKKGWYLVILIEDASHYKRDKDGHFRCAEHFIPVRFTYEVTQPHLPADLTKHSVKESCRVVLYTAAAVKLDAPAHLSYQPAWLDKWVRAMKSLAAGERSALETAWLEHAEKNSAQWRPTLAKLAKEKHPPTQLHFAKRLNEKDKEIMQGKRSFPHEAPADLVRRLSFLWGHLKIDDFLVRMETTLRRPDLDAALPLSAAQVDGEGDGIDYTRLLPLPAR